MERKDGEWLLRYLPDAVPPRVAELGELKRRLTARLGLTGGVALRASDAIMPEKSGKFRLGYPAP